MVYNIYSLPRRSAHIYLELLYGHTEGDVGNARFVFHDLSWRKLVVGPLDEAQRYLIHVHWETHLYSSRNAILAGIKLSLRAVALLIAKKRGIRIVWTKHNMTAHDARFPRLDRFVTYLMWSLADVVIIQERTFAEVQRRQSKHPSVVCIPPGNYIGAYGPLWTGSVTKLRSQLGLPVEGIIILALGAIRPYKALPVVIQAVKRAQKKGQRIHLLIAGAVGADYASVIERHIEGDKSITLKAGYIPDDKLPEYLGVADYTICYYTDSALGSGAIMLSLSYGVPVLTRDFPASELVIPGTSGYIFHDEKDLDLLLSHLRRIHSSREQIMSTVHSQSWRSAGVQLRRVYQNLW